MIGVTPASFFGETVGERPDAWIPLAMQATVLPGRDWLRDQPASVEKVMWLHAFGAARVPASLVDRAQASANLVFQQGLLALLRVGGRCRDAHGALSRPAPAPEAGRHRRVVGPRRSFRAAAGAAGRRRSGAAHRLRQPRQPAAGAHHGARPRDGRAAGAGRQPAAGWCASCSPKACAWRSLGGVAGLATALSCAQALLRLVADSSIALPAAIDLRTLAFVFGLTLVAGLLLGLLPALRITKTRSSARGCASRAAASPDPSHGCGVGKLVVVGQLALSLPLLVGAGLLVRTLVNLQQVDLGYPKDGVLTVRVDARAAGYEPAASGGGLRLDCSTRIRAVPGVRAATYSNNGSVRRIGQRRSDHGRGLHAEGARRHAARATTQIGPQYFSTLGIPVLLGREISEDGSRRRTNRLRHQRDVRRSASSPAAIRSACTSRSSTPISVTPTRSSAWSAIPVRTGCARDIEHRFYVPATQPAASISGA